MTVSVFPRVIRDGLVMDYDPAHLASYNSRENLLLNSEQLDQAPWTVFGSTTRTANQLAAPDGTLTADQIGNTPSFFQDVTVPANATLTASIYVRSTAASGTVSIGLALWWVGGSNVTLTMNPQTGGFISAGSGGGSVTYVGYTIEDVGNGWYRISISGTNTTGLTTARFEIYNNSGAASSYFVWGAQLERSRTVSGYVPTTGTAVTRSTTLNNLVSALYPGTIIGTVAYNSDGQGSFYGENTAGSAITLYTIPDTFWNASSWTVSAWVKITASRFLPDNPILSHGAISTNNGLHLGIRGQAIYFGFYGNDWALENAMPINSWAHISWVYDHTQAQKLIYLNGVLRTNTGLTGGVRYSGTGGNTELMRYVWGTDQRLLGWLGRVQIYNRVLAAPEISQIYSSLAGRYA